MPSCGQADMAVSPSTPGAHTHGAEDPVVPGIRTSLAADLVVAVAARVQPGGVAALIPGHLDWVFLQPPDQALHQTKLDQPPGDEEQRDGTTNPKVPNAPAPHNPFCSTCPTTPSRFLPHRHRAEYFLLTVSATPSATTTLRV